MVFNLLLVKSNLFVQLGLMLLQLPKEQHSLAASYEQELKVTAARVVELEKLISTCYTSASYEDISNEIKPSKF